MLDSPAISKAPLLLLAPLAFATGCYVEGDFEAVEEINVSQQSICMGPEDEYGRCCSGWGSCDANGDRAGAYMFDDLNLDGGKDNANAQGLYIKRFQVYGFTFPLENQALKIRDNELVWETQDGSYSLSAPDGASFVVGSIHDDNWEIKISIDEVSRQELADSDDYREIKHWVGPEETMRTYLLKREGPRPGEVAWLCEQGSFYVPKANTHWIPIGSGTNSAVEPHTGNLALLTVGHRYDSERKRVQPFEWEDRYSYYMHDYDRWITFGCAGGVAAKAELMRYTKNGPNYSWATLQSLYKMLAGDFCGAGESYTVEGQQLRWVDAGQQYPPEVWVNDGVTLPLQALEARWDPNGAVCLNREVSRPENLARIERLSSECGKRIPDCDESAMHGFVDSRVFYRGPDEVTEHTGLTQGTILLP